MATTAWGGEEHFVTLNGAGAKTGADWANAFSLADFNTSTNWDTDDADDNKIGQGDTVYFSGGSSGVVYNDTMTIQKSGAIGNPITIKPGAAHPSLSAGHDGLVTFTDSASYGMLMYHQYITINGNDGAGNRKIRVTGNYLSGVAIANATKGVLITYLTVDKNGTKKSGADVNGFRLNNLTDYEATQRLEISYCDIDDNYQDQINITGNAAGSSFDTVLIHDNLIHGINDDGIEYSNISGVSIYNNLFYGWGTGGGGHPDHIASNGGTYTKIYNNYFYGWEDDTHTLNANILPSGFTSTVVREVTDVYVYNNVMYNDNLNPKGGTSVARGIEITTGSSSSVTAMRRIYAFNNTLINQPFYGISVNFASGFTIEDVRVENNILSGCGITTTNAFMFNAGTHTRGSHGDEVEMVMDYNLFYAGTNGKTIIKNESDFYSHADFKTATGCQDHGVLDNPLLNSTTHIPDTSFSPAIDAGVTFAFTDEDKAGTTRPVGAAWDIGAYEYDGSVYYLLTVTVAGTGTGTVTSSPSGISCGEDCTQDYAEDTVVTLTASPSGGSTATWSGEGCSGSTTCVVTMSAAKNPTITWTEAPTPPAGSIGGIQTGGTGSMTLDGTGTGSITIVP